jgi:hypothetical protein
MPALTPKWEIVAQALSNGDSHRLAYEAGGYKFNRASAYRLCTKPEIVKRAAEIRKEREEMSARARQVAAQESGVDLGWVEKHQKQVVLLAMRGEPVRDRDGRKKVDPETGEPIYKRDLQAANQGLVTLGRMKGAFIDRTEIGGPGDFARLTEAELDRKITELVGVALPEKAATLLIEHMQAEAAE